LKYINRLFKDPTNSYFLFGPRGTGKSTYFHCIPPEAIWVDLLKPADLRSFMARPERLEELVLGNPTKTVVVIDEIQRAPGLLSVVHGLIETKRGLKFILTGSSARKLKRVSADLLGGRALKCSLLPFMAAEVGDLFSLTRALKIGLLPLIFNNANPQDVLQAYVSLYLHEEIQAEGLVRNIDDFSRFLEVISFSHAATLNVANIARECEVKRKTVENYLQILEDLLLAHTLPVFSKRAQRELSSHPKFYLFDTGVFNALRPRGPLDNENEINGAALEGLVFQHLLAWVDYTTNGKHELYFWRTRSGVEVDFIIYGTNGLWALEVKNSKCIRSEDLTGLESFLIDYPEAQAMLIYRGDECLKIKNVLCIPCDIFLQQLKPDQDIFTVQGN
jgi:predicted AAA+ superfamily ATPase